MNTEKSKKEKYSSLKTMEGDGGGGGGQYDVQFSYMS